jgi:diaminopimelate epimerase
MQIRFEKYQGTGNDFIMIDNRDKNFPIIEHTIKKLCDRKWGIGADGLILIENEESVDFKMVYFNADGRPSTMCGNGGRCATVFASHLGIFSHLQNIKFLAADGLHEGFILGKLNDYGYQTKISMKEVNAIEVYDETSIIVDTGSPHFVKRCQGIRQINIIDEARKIRNNERFYKEGINVNFLENIDGEIQIRTYERGVEDETLSCGTGVVASAIAADYWNLNTPLKEIVTPGGRLSVDFKKSGTKYTDIFLTGPAEKVFSGKVEI